MPNLYMTIGMIGSGKSTWAKSFVKNNKNVKIISGDDLREMTAGYYLYEPTFENILNAIIKETAIQLLLNSYSVILDECNLIRQNRRIMVEQINEASFPNYINAVVFNTHSKEWHLNNRYKNLRGYTKQLWSDVYDKHTEIFEPFNKKLESYFDGVIYVD